MTSEKHMNSNPWLSFSGPNLGYVLDKYEKFLKDKNSVDPHDRYFFENYGRPNVNEFETAPKPERVMDQSINIEHVVSTVRLVENIRTYGHLLARINPLFGVNNIHSLPSFLNLEEFNLTIEDLQVIPAHYIWKDAPNFLTSAYDVVTYLKEKYSSTLAYEFNHVYEQEEREWLTNMVEQDHLRLSLSDNDKVQLLERLTEIEEFERFLHKSFVGQKRFSIEGLDMLVPILDRLIGIGVNEGCKNVILGMAHRGRLNVLAHVLGKPYHKIFSEFVHSPNKEMIPSEGSKGINFGWTGDVKYHLGANRTIADKGSTEVKVTLMNNPSHLEFIGPVVEGYTRAAQEELDQKGHSHQYIQKSFAVLIHGDAAFPGEGVVAETLNLSRLKGYETGGTIHIIANNQLGFTTDPMDARSTKYASDLAKGFEIPIVHVNSDDPEACLQAAELAYQYRKIFHKDFLINLIGYRCFGHNEIDDPMTTQPLLYKKIQQHPTVQSIYAKVCEEAGLITQNAIQDMKNTLHDQFQRIYADIKSKDKEKNFERLDILPAKLPEINTAIPLKTLQALNGELMDWPKSFHPYPKLERILTRRMRALSEQGVVDWGLAESLAFASILKDGRSIRFTGQDVGRGTFAHRHVVLKDSENGETYIPLQHLNEATGSFQIFNSPLSETAVLGFEYGYDVFAPQTLVIWEAQFGDFANVAQVIFDQFIAAGRAKWGQKSGLVMLLPHGYEGQGPEHSSARLERYLQLAAENNWTVANVTSSSQYFHVLRRQALIKGHESVRPLVIMTPKSLLRHAKAASKIEKFSEGGFQPVLEPDDASDSIDQVERLVLCSGKMAIDLETEREKIKKECVWLRIIRIEELYPFPAEEIEHLISRYPNLRELVWVQEEPKNMGAWQYIAPYLRECAPHHMDLKYIGRPRRSSPASGEPDIHKREQRRIIVEALKQSK
ncbi:2-oxoglutarate dehydrogenase E1 component [Terrilactibacillus sp. BCM23-1]|uniref:2-oxoglutarate dehydrogenase E1 component n=1 Tax=Terrilactibacillus tamarindi TaxID=2599694 RepID=A0A6N8CLM2_9BACI|nr:2-oxoglutarate dehydrogenase E1 component [Terrilactibacillus tamarindi]MTT30438.1 2-oxoglutarate dehydrogenase E1 component [Terrilactibacillus tamarindi]